MNAQLESLVGSLLYEGYALYPYTPGATKNATPTPFGIVYPPVYAAENQATHDHLRLECVLEAKSAEGVRGTVRFLQASGRRHKAAERRVELAIGEAREFEFDGLRGRVAVRAEELGEGLWLVRACVHNATEVEPGLDRAEALVASLVSTHLVLEAAAGRFISPLEPESEPCESVNTFPVLASPADDAILGAAIVLPDHPRIAPESLGNLFDNTEIEEALLLHVQALSDSEREEIAAQDPAVRSMVERAAAADPQDVISLHGLMRPSAELPADPGPEPEPGHPNPGEPELEIDGIRFRKGAKVVLRPGTDRDVYDRMLDGRQATIERLYIDYDDGAHVAVTIDDDPGQELFRETGRYLFFKAGELEAIAE